MSNKGTIFKNQSPWGSSQGGNNGSGTRREPPNIDDVIKVKELDPFGVILGKALYENHVTIGEAKQA